MRKKFPQEIGAKITVPRSDSDTIMRACACGFEMGGGDAATVTLWRRVPDGHIETNGFKP